jgi:hypothetical protein
MVAAAAALVAGAAPLRAQSGAVDEAALGEGRAEQPFTRGLLSTSAFFYREDASEVVGGNDQASPQDLEFADLRARLEAGDLGGSRWGGLGDFRLRLTSDDLAARGFEGGGEYHLREAYVGRRGDRVDLSLGRLVLRDVDATRVDGGALVLHTQSRSWEYGAFAGAYPNPLSRSLDTDYSRGGEGAGPPVAGGAWAAYNSGRNHGAVGLAGIAPRDAASAADPEPTRVFASSSGYHLIGDRLDVFHYLVADLAGPGGAELLSANVGANWRASSLLRVEAGFSHMSTYAVEIYVRDLLEKPDPDPEAGAPVQNNLALVRMASDEGRLGAVLSMPKRVDLHGEVRLRRRDALTDAQLPMEIAGLDADDQVDLSGGLRQRDSLLGLDLSGVVISIRGQRTASTFATVRAHRALVDGRLDLELETGLVDYSDRCDGGDPTCTGDLDGRTWRGGGQLVLLPARGWLFLGDYRFAWNTADRAGMAQPDILSHALFLRVQRSF